MKLLNRIRKVSATFQKVASQTLSQALTLTDPDPEM